ncbi:Nop domain-containing protein [Saitoella complicata NRRL Y-17804]|uniref:Nop domain-containing protein n=1 Tax=Saitoella complicata (strain BCRC 22490 / CBS 7301 / JCM 7358 / NBRC 10748 / NRRL Y-17804) TaxID=698492 RepID=A0A0E9N7Z1_SAICN|nr:Nop domain-containing protein [Saitoella complicata NRRL Y-17804]ODQ55617.1 Nop domain-containing protein [Saitoella complicata NRRL Y-17804]GAO46032.1 hypothetical protein G7K_0277-t1 [Saitoella complicata NRRL Y-17804]
MSLADELLMDFDDDEVEQEELNTGADEALDEEAAARNAMDAEKDEENKLFEVDVKGVDDVRSIAKLIDSSELNSVLERIDHFSTNPRQTLHGSPEQDPEYALIVQANSLTTSLSDDLHLVLRFIRDHFAPRFPELEQLVPDPVMYVSAVQAIRNEMDLTAIDLKSILPSATVMVVTVTSSTTTGTPLPPDKLVTVESACEVFTRLRAAREKITSYVSSRLSFFAPNLAALLGASTAANLISQTGGLSGLAKIPACNIPSLGGTKARGLGLASNVRERQQGFLYHSPVIQSCPLDVRKQAQRIMSAKLLLAARVDLARSSPDGSMGQTILQQVQEKLEKLAEPPTSKGPKALPAPDDPVRKKRGGKRIRKAKEAFAVTELRKLQNRVQFGGEEVEVGFGDETEGLGMINAEGLGKLRAAAIDTRTRAKASKSTLSRLAAANASGMKSVIGGRETSGLASSVVLGSKQGIELVNPELVSAMKKKKDDDEGKDWFKGGLFSQIKR